MKKIVKYSLFALLVYLLSLLVLFPADRAYSLLRDRAGLPLELYRLSGSIWNGHIGMARATAVSIDDIDWCLHVLPLLMGRLELGLTIAAGSANPLQLVVGRYLDGSLYIHDDGQELSVAKLENLLNPQPLGLTGTLMFDLDDMRLASGRLMQLNGDVTWYHAGLGDPVNIDVGDLAARVSTSDDVVQATVKDQGGPLAVDGQVMLMPDNTYRMTMTLMVKDNTRSDLRQSLKLLGTPNRDGKVSVTRRGRLDLGLR